MELFEEYHQKLYQSRKDYLEKERNAIIQITWNERMRKNINEKKNKCEVLRAETKALQQTANSRKENVQAKTLFDNLTKKRVADLIERNTTENKTSLIQESIAKNQAQYDELVKGRTDSSQGQKLSMLLQEVAANEQKLNAISIEVTNRVEKLQSLKQKLLAEINTITKLVKELEQKIPINEAQLTSLEMEMAEKEKARDALMKDTYNISTFDIKKTISHDDVQPQMPAADSTRTLFTEAFKVPFPSSTTDEKHRKKTKKAVKREALQTKEAVKEIPTPVTPIKEPFKEISSKTSSSAQKEKVPKQRRSCGLTVSITETQAGSSKQLQGSSSNIKASNVTNNPDLTGKSDKLNKRTMSVDERQLSNFSSQISAVDKFDLFGRAQSQPESCETKNKTPSLPKEISSKKLSTLREDKKSSQDSSQDSQKKKQSKNAVKKQAQNKQEIKPPKPESPPKEKPEAKEIPEGKKIKVLKQVTFVKTAPTVEPSPAHSTPARSEQSLMSPELDSEIDFRFSDDGDLNEIIEENSETGGDFFGNKNTTSGNNWF